MSSSSSGQFNSICAIKSIILLEMKCPLLSKPEATVARNQNSIGDRTEKKPWEKVFYVKEFGLSETEYIIDSLLTHENI